MPNLQTNSRYETMHRLAERLDRLGIVYAFMSVDAFGVHPADERIEVLLTREGFDRFERESVNAGYRQVPGRPRRFEDPRSGITLEVRLTGHYPGIHGPGPVAFPDPAAVREDQERFQVVALACLIQLKLAARCFKDSADVVALIGARRLDESFAAKLHPAVRDDYLRYLREKRREKEFEALP